MWLSLNLVQNFTYQSQPNFFYETPRNESVERPELLVNKKT